MEKVRIEFAISFLEISGNVQLFCYINSNCVLSSFEEKKNAVVQWRMGRIEFSITSLEPVGYSEPNGNVQIFFYRKSNFPTPIEKTSVAQWEGSDWISDDISGTGGKLLLFYFF